MYGGKSSVLCGPEVVKFLPPGVMWHTRVSRSMTVDSHGHSDPLVCASRAEPSVWPGRACECGRVVEGGCCWGSVGREMVIARTFDVPGVPG